MVAAPPMAMAKVKQIQVTLQVYINPCISCRKWKLFSPNEKGATSHKMVTLCVYTISFNQFLMYSMKHKNVFLTYKECVSDTLTIYFLTHKECVSDTLTIYF
jgi:hypothetical protein